MNFQRSVFPSLAFTSCAVLLSTFALIEVSTQATNLDLPFDPNLPAGLQGIAGISVDAEFSPDNWATVIRQPAFWYQPYTFTVRSNQDHLVPNGRHAGRCTLPRSKPEPGSIACGHRMPAGRRFIWGKTLGQFMAQVELCRKYGFGDLAVFDERTITDEILAVLAATPK